VESKDFFNVPLTATLGAIRQASTSLRSMTIKNARSRPWGGYFFFAIRATLWL
ncbi:unnamed protein product, partial [Acidithrix sp. C25]